MLSIPNRPDRGILHAEAPKRSALDAGTFRGARLVIRCNAIGQPDLVNAIVFVLVRIVRVEGVIVEHDIRARLDRCDDALLKSDGLRDGMRITLRLRRP